MLALLENKGEPIESVFLHFSEETAEAAVVFAELAIEQEQVNDGYAL